MTALAARMGVTGDSLARIAGPLVIVMILAIVVMARGFTGKGMIPLLASLVVSPIVYFIGIAVLAGAISSAAHMPVG